MDIDQHHDQHLHPASYLAARPQRPLQQIFATPKIQKAFCQVALLNCPPLSLRVCRGRTPHAFRPEDRCETRRLHLYRRKQPYVQDTLTRIDGHNVTVLVHPAFKRSIDMDATGQSLNPGILTKRL